MTRIPGSRALLLITAAVALLGASACSTESQPSPTPTTTTVTAEPTTVDTGSGGSAGAGETTTVTQTGDGRSGDGGSGDGGSGDGGSGDGAPGDIPARPAAGDSQPLSGFANQEPGYFFISPSGNVYCGMREPGSPSAVAETTFGCQTKTSVAPAGGPTCRNSANNTYMVSIDNGAVTHRCTSQGVFTAPDQATLAYGQSISAYGNTCLSTTDGITCWSSSGTGFMISRDVNRTF